MTKPRSNDTILTTNPPTKRTKNARSGRRQAFLLGVIFAFYVIWKQMPTWPSGGLPSRLPLIDLHLRVR